MARERGGRPDASVWFDAGEKLPVADAAQVNAVMSDAAASDDSDLRNIVHRRHAADRRRWRSRNARRHGEAVLTAIVCGYEAAGRISDAITPGFRDRGFHGCLGAIFAAAVAAAGCCTWTRRRAQTIALTATSIGGLATAADTSVAREYHAGLAAMLGVNAALAAQRGYTARNGFWRRIAGSSKRSAASMARRPGDRDAGSGHESGTSSPTWRSSWCRAATPTMRSPRRPAMPPARPGRRGGSRKHHLLAARHDHAERARCIRPT